MTELPDVMQMIQDAPVVPPPQRGAELRNTDDLPFVALGDGSEMQLLQVDLEQGLWIVRMKFHPGCQIDKHYHTGPVFAFTTEGAWHYLEYPDEVNRAGAYLFEPAGSVHTLRAHPDSDGPADVWFTVFGANVNIAEDGSVSSIVDAATVLNIYRALGDAQGLDTSKVLVSGS